MSIYMRGGIWHWRKMLEGHKFSASCKTADKKLAQQMAAVWEAEAITEVLLRGTKPMNLHAVLDAFLAARKDKVGGINARVHLRHFYEIADQRMSKVTLQDLNAVIEKRRKAGTAHNTLAVTVSYWNAVVNYAEAQKWTTAIKLPRLQAERTRLRFLTVEEEAALFATIDPTADYPGKCARSDAARQNNTDLLIGLLHLGCRYREIARMKWSQVDFDTGLVVVYRGRRHRQQHGDERTAARHADPAPCGSHGRVGFPYQAQTQQQLCVDAGRPREGRDQRRGGQGHPAHHASLVCQPHAARRDEAPRGAGTVGPQALCLDAHLRAFGIRGGREPRC